jgi:peptidoglycan/LPS O-acetylase OafA/YrhL
MTSVVNGSSEPQANKASTDRKTERIHYLDWLRLILILGVFVFHAVSPFVPITWHIKNPDTSMILQGIILAFFPVGMPLFFLISGAGGTFALRRRSNQQYIWERVTRLLIPFIVGAILLTPFQKYLEALHKETFQGSFLSYIPQLLTNSFSGDLFTPLVFPRWGLHLWFLGFLFAFSLIGLPFFRWFQRDSGTTFMSWLDRLVQRRGGLLLFILPLVLVRLLIQPFFAEEHGWLDFVYFFLFFLMGYVIFSGEHFLGAIDRDRSLLLGVGLMCLVALFGIMGGTSGGAYDWFLTFVVPWSILVNILFTGISWCGALYFLYQASKYLNYSNRYLAYGNQTIMPFYLIHQPVIIVIAYIVVQWEIGILVKLLVVLLGSFTITIGLVELLIRPFKPMRKLFGMKSRRREKVGA